MAISGITSSSLYELLSQILFPGAQSSRANTTPSQATIDGLAGLYRTAARLRKELEKLEQQLNKSFISRGEEEGGAAISGLTLLDGSSSRLTATGEVNATPTSYSPFGPSWTGGSTALPTIGGVYSGADGTGTMIVTVTNGGTIGSASHMSLRVTIGSHIEDVPIPGRTTPDTPLTLSNGMVLSFGAGTLVKNDEFEAQVYSSVGSGVNPDLPFNGTRNNNPNLEYGTSIVEGSFQVNGITINVSSGDTLNQVLNRITESAAGVDAAFDSSTETVRLVAKASGSRPIVLSGDTSGFLAATKLSGATVVSGSTQEDTERIADVTRLAGISSGAFYINGHEVAVDVAADSVEDVVSRINSAATGVTAEINSGKIQLTGDSPFELDDGTSHFFSALGIQAGDYGQETRRTGHDAAHETAAQMKTVADLFNEFFGSSALSSIRSGMLRQNFTGFATRAFHQNGPRFESNFGIALDLNTSAEKVFSFGRESLRQALASRPESVRQLFISSVDSHSLI